MADDSEQLIIRGKHAIYAVKEKMSAILNEVNNIWQSLRDLKEDAENFHEKWCLSRTEDRVNWRIDGSQIATGQRIENDGFIRIKNQF